jgi:hypothetical protein
MTDQYRGTEVFARRRTRRAAEARRPTRILGLVSLLAALVTIVLFWMGMSFAVGDRNLVSADLAYLATGTSVVAVIGGVAAIILRRGRALGAVAVVLGLLASPLLLARLLGWASGLG